MKVTVQVVTQHAMTARNRCAKWPVWSVDDLTPATLGLSLAEGKTHPPGASKKWWWNGRCRRISTSNATVPQCGKLRHSKGSASHRLSDRLWRPAGGKSPPHPLRLSGP